MTHPDPLPPADCGGGEVELVSMRDLLQGTTWWRGAATNHPGLLGGAATAVRDVMCGPNAPVPGGEAVWMNALTRAYNAMPQAVDRVPPNADNRHVLLACLDLIDTWEVVDNGVLLAAGLERDQRVILLAHAVHAAASVMIILGSVTAARAVEEAARALLDGEATS